MFYSLKNVWCFVKVHKKYASCNQEQRHEPKYLMPHQVNFAIEEEFLPQTGKKNLSHTCGNKFCIVVDHIVYELASINSTRKSCKMKSCNLPHKADFKKVTPNHASFNCEHKPICFYNTGTSTATDN